MERPSPHCLLQAQMRPSPFWTDSRRSPKGVFFGYVKPTGVAPLVFT